jgi:hypothetical protein
VRTTDAQVRKLMNEMTKHGQVGLAAVRAGMDRKTARKYVREGKLPSDLVEPRAWRTRADPFADDWAWVEEQLKASPTLEAKTLFDALCEQRPEVVRGKPSVVHSKPLGRAQSGDARGGRPDGRDLCSNDRRHEDLTDGGRQQVEQPDPREIDQRRAVSDDDHVRSSDARCERVELAPEVVEVVVDGEQAVLARRDQEVVEGHAERSGGAGGRNAVSSTRRIGAPTWRARATGSCRLLDTPRNRRARG